MDCKFQNIKICEGNDFSILFPLQQRVYVSGMPIDEDIDILSLTDVVIKCEETPMPCTQQADGLLVDFPATMARGTYDITIAAKYRGHDLRAAYFEAITIVAWNYQSDAERYVQGSPIIMQPAFVIYNLTDAELAQLKQDLRDAIAAAEQAEADAEQAKEEWEQKAADLDNVAQQDTLTQGISDIRGDIGNIQIDTSTLAKQGTNPNANITDIAAFFNITPPVPNAVPMTQQEVEDDLDELWNLIITQ